MAGKQVVETLLEIAVQMEVDIVLIQEPTTGKGSTARHDGFRWIKGEQQTQAKCWTAINKAAGCKVTEIRGPTDECVNCIQVLEVTREGREKVVLVNVYDQRPQVGQKRLAQQADWEAIMAGGRVVIAGDMNAHSQKWNPRATKRRNATFWEDLIEKHELVIWNSEEGTRAGPGANGTSIIDLTLSTPAITLNWSLLEGEASGSDHEVILWEIIEGGEKGGQSRVVTGWDIAGWSNKGKAEEDRKEAEKKAEQARTTFAQLTRHILINDESTEGEIEEVAIALRSAMTETLERHAKQRRWCTRSKRWWTDELRDLRKILARVRRKRDWEAAREAKRNQRREIRRAKKKCWNTFLQKAKGKEVWAAVRYTTTRLDKTGQALRVEGGPLLEGSEAREKALIKAHFPASPRPGGENEEEKDGGEGYKQVDEALVGELLRKASTTAPEEDRISVDILKVFWEWERHLFVELTRACIRVGYHPAVWKTAKGVVIPKANKPDYSQVRAYRVISLLDVIGKLVERTAAYLIADHLERSKGLHEGQYGCHKRRATVDAVAILMNRTEQAWEKKNMAGTLLMDVQAAFNNTDSQLLRRSMEALGIQQDLIRWTGSFMRNRKVRLVLDGTEGEAYEVDTGIP